MLSAASIMSEKQKTMFGGEIRFNEPMSRHTSWRVGGPADTFFIPDNKEDLQVYLKSLGKQEAIYWIGLGSNILVRDEGVKGTVIFTCGKLKKNELVGKNRIYAEAGTPCAHIARFSSANGLVGAEFFAGIPGTLGGALAMNAGAFGGETWDLVDSVVTIDRSGYFQKRTPNDYRIGYRSVTGPGQEWFFSAIIRLVKGDTSKSRFKIKNLLAKRANTQPTNVPSCGSVFRNPDQGYAAELIEEAGLKGRRIGGACVSEKHANFILNSGSATAEDIESLIDLIVETVDSMHGIRLQPEVRIIGEKRTKSISWPHER